MKSDEGVYLHMNTIYTTASANDKNRPVLGENFVYVVAQFWFMG